MPLARAAIYAQHCDIYLAPTWDNSDTWVATLRHIAKEGRQFVIGVAPLLRGSDVPEDCAARSTGWTTTGCRAATQPSSHRAVTSSPGRSWSVKRSSTPTSTSPRCDRSDGCSTPWALRATRRVHPSRRHPRQEPRRLRGTPCGALTKPIVRLFQSMRSLSSQRTAGPERANVPRHRTGSVADFCLRGSQTCGSQTCCDACSSQFFSVRRAWQEADLATTAATVIPGSEWARLRNWPSGPRRRESLEGPPGHLESLVELAGGGRLRLTDRGRRRVLEDDV